MFILFSKRCVLIFLAICLYQLDAYMLCGCICIYRIKLTFYLCYIGITFSHIMLCILVKAQYYDYSVLIVLTLKIIFVCEILTKDQNCITRVKILAAKLLNWKKLSSMKDRGQTDRVTALPRPYALDIDLYL